MKSVISVCQIQIILSLIAVMIAFCPNADAAKLGLASAWLFDDNGGKVAKDVVSGHDGEIKGSLSNGSITVNSAARWIFRARVIVTFA